MFFDLWCAYANSVGMFLYYFLCCLRWVVGISWVLRCLVAVRGFLWFTYLRYSWCLLFFGVLGNLVVFWYFWGLVFLVFCLFMYLLC